LDGTPKTIQKRRRAQKTARSSTFFLRAVAGASQGPKGLASVVFVELRDGFDWPSQKQDYLGCAPQ
jgi:hypothetical protein